MPIIFDSQSIELFNIYEPLMSAVSDILKLVNKSLVDIPTLSYNLTLFAFIIFDYKSMSSILFCKFNYEYYMPANILIFEFVMVLSNNTFEFIVFISNNSLKIFPTAKFPSRPL